MKTLHFLFLCLSSGRKEPSGGDLERRAEAGHKGSVGDSRCLVLDLTCGTLPDLLGVRAFSPLLSSTQCSSCALKPGENPLLS